jgi:hypothetical protein
MGMFHALGLAIGATRAVTLAQQRVIRHGNRQATPSPLDSPGPTLQVHVRAE